MTKQNATILYIALSSGCVGSVSSLIADGSSMPAMKQKIAIIITAILLSVSFFVFKKYNLGQVNPRMAHTPLGKLFTRYPMMVSVLALAIGVAAAVGVRLMLD